MTIEEFMKKDLNECILSLSSNNHDRRKYVKDLIDDEEFIKEIFEVKRYTTLKAQTEIFKKKFGRSAGCLEEICKKHNIQIPTASESAKLSMSQRYETNKIKYGGSGNILSKGSVKAIKRDNTVKSKYGVDNVFQNQEIKEKIQNTCLEKYGVKNPGIIFGNFYNFSNPHKIVSDYLNSIGVIHQNESRGKFHKYNHQLQKDYCPFPDILIEEKGIVIEIYGDFWHCNPLLYFENDIIKTKNRYGKEIFAKEIWERDKIREDHIKSFGYDLIVIWESEIKNESYKEKLNDVFAI